MKKNKFYKCSILFSFFFILFTNSIALGDHNRVALKLFQKYGNIEFENEKLNIEKIKKKIINAEKQFDIKSLYKKFNQLKTLKNNEIINKFSQEFKGFGIHKGNCFPKNNLVYRCNNNNSVIVDFLYEATDLRKIIVSSEKRFIFDKITRNKTTSKKEFNFAMDLFLEIIKRQKFDKFFIENSGSFIILIADM